MTFRVLTAELSHETNTFSRQRTGRQAFEDRYVFFGHDAVAARGGANTELAGFLDVGRKFDWQIEHVVSAAAGPSGTVEKSVFEWLAGAILAVAQPREFDGILLGLHGAMALDFCEDGDGELLRRIRASCGEDVPIAITLDSHANVSRQMCSLADIIVSFRTYPHVDMRETGIRAARILQATMAGEINPRTIRVGRPMLEETNGGRTDAGPMIARLAAAEAYEIDPDVFAVSINAGFASTDVCEVGPTVLVTGQGDFDRHIAFANSIADDIWARRFETLNEYLTVDAAADLAAAFEPGEGPLIVADYADNPGAGSYGDSAALLSALLERGVANACFAPMVDADAVRTLSGFEIGDRVFLDLGGKVDPDFGGGPVRVEVELLVLSDGWFVGDGPILGGQRRSFGPSAVVRVDDIEVLIVSVAQQILDLQQLKSFGIDPERKSVIALKSMHHFRAAFEPIAGQVIVCDSGALCTLAYQRLPYQNVPRPIFPLDEEPYEPRLRDATLP